jgi:hypothetical protein
MITTTLNRIREHSPCTEGWVKLLAHLGKTVPDHFLEGQLTMPSKIITAIRHAMREQFGARRYRITRDGTIHVHGRMPNSIVVGWYEYGGVGDPVTLERLGITPWSAP